MAVYVSNIVIDQGYFFDTTYQLEDTRTNEPLILGNSSTESRLKKTYTSSSSVSFASTISDPISGDLYVGGDLYVAETSIFQNNISVTGSVTVTEGIYYDFGDYDGPNGVAYFDNSGKLVGAASAENALTTSYFILTTDAVGIPIWTSIIDGEEL